MPKRTDRLGSLIEHEIADIMLRELADPRLRFASITRVRLTGDLRYAKVFVSVIGDAVARKEAVAVLDQSKGFVRHLLGTRIRVRFLPELIFVEDDSIETGARVMSILEMLRKERGEDGAAGEVEGGLLEDKEED